MDLKGSINLDLYPIFDLHGAEIKRVCQKAQQDLDERGLTVLPSFLTRKAVRELVDWTESNHDQTFFQEVSGNAYLTDGDPSLPDDHALNRIETTSLGVLAYDQFGDDNLLKKIYLTNELKEFLELILRKEPLYYYQCPLGALNIAVMRPGDQLRWHFDQSDFVVSIPLQEAEAGGQYRYVRNARTAEDQNYGGVIRILAGDGDASAIQALEAGAGDLVIFEGRYTLHCVTEVMGTRNRLVALLSFVDKPNVTSTDYLRKIRYGRTR
ncbi:MAG: hypothetical protein MJE77_06610 [Proteobacteria bacterium]|nr:hypothetical protein [Pseudomonadota bacterium]